MKKIDFNTLSIAAFVSITMIAHPVMAQVDLGDTSGDGDTSWSGYLVDGLTGILDGLVTIGAVVLGIGLCVWGIVGAINGKLDPMQALTRVVGGIVAVAAPFIGPALLNFINS
jgi:hypothetical protein